jgi:hypothetical protein
MTNWRINILLLKEINNPQDARTYKRHTHAQDSSKNDRRRNKH